MKSQNNINPDVTNLVALNDNELSEYEGGILALMGLVFGALGVGLAAAYGVGYAVGKLSK